MIDYRIFGIKPSNIISSLCYSVFKLEPYSSCSYNCIYCYARWYRGEELVTTAKLLWLWSKIASKLAKIEAPKPYFRLSTLVEPFQELEEKHMVSYKLLETAYISNIPVVVNTKSTLLTKPPWIDLLVKMSEKKLVLVQYTVLTSNSEIAEKLESRAPPPDKRLQSIEKLIENNIPVVIRIQPLIPGLEEQHAQLLRELPSGVKGIITESLRASIEDLYAVSRILGLDLKEYTTKYDWRPYTTRAENLYRPGDNWVSRVTSEIMRLAKSRGLVYSSCKDTPLIMRSDCCLFWLTGNNGYGVRETIREKLYQVKTCGVRIISKQMYSDYPNPVRKILRLHNNKLEKILRDENLLRELLSSVGISSGLSPHSNSASDR
ncbi:MAG: radical SAM protein [Thermoprotei archaeon]